MSPTAKPFTGSEKVMVMSNGDIFLYSPEHPLSRQPAGMVSTCTGPVSVDASLGFCAKSVAASARTWNVTSPSEVGFGVIVIS